jgi:CRISPR-associated Csx14 family protein
MQPTNTTRIPRTLIATLGSESQVVTLALDLLAQRGRDQNRVIVVHTSPDTPVIAQALSRLAAEMQTHPAYKAITYAPMPIADVLGNPLTDVENREGSETCFRTIYQILRAIKREGHHVDLCLAGGRKAMSAYAMVAAQLLFEEDDRLWHLVSYGRLLVDKRMHAGPNDETALIELPVLRYGDVSPMLSSVADADDPFEAVQRSETRARALHMKRARQFVNDVLTEAERRTVIALVREGLSDTQLAEKFTLSVKTIQTQLSAAYRKAAEFFELDDVQARALISLLAPITDTV